MIEINDILIMVCVTFFGAFGSIYLKKGAAKFELKLEQFKNRDLQYGFLMFFMGSAIYVLALRSIELHIAYSLTSITYIFITILSNYILKEKITWHKIMGITLIILGIFFLAIA